MVHDCAPHTSRSPAIGISSARPSSTSTSRSSSARLTSNPRQCAAAVVLNDRTSSRWRAIARPARGLAENAPDLRLSAARQDNTPTTIHGDIWREFKLGDPNATYHVHPPPVPPSRRTGKLSCGITSPGGKIHGLRRGHLKLPASRRTAVRRALVGDSEDRSKTNGEWAWTVASSTFYRPAVRRSP